MSMRYLMDENLDPLYKTQLLARTLELIVYAVGDPGVPARGTLGPELLCWWEENRCILVTNNRKSMPLHLKDHLAQGHHIPGIITLNEDMSIGDNIEELVLIAGASFDNEYWDRIEYLPISH
jgi:hypothetical protein